jgi:hypothetical protein
MTRIEPSRVFPGGSQSRYPRKSAHDIIVERTLRGDALLGADLKAGTGRKVLDWWLDVRFEELQSQPVSFVCIASVTSSPDGIQSFLNWIAAFAGRVSYIVFKNFKDGDYLPDYDTNKEAIIFRGRYAK